MTLEKSLVSFFFPLQKNEKKCILTSGQTGQRNTEKCQLLEYKDFQFVISVKSLFYGVLFLISSTLLQIGHL